MTHAFFVVRKGAKYRLVIDLRGLNDLVIESTSVQYMDLPRILPKVAKDSFLWSIDLTSAFHHVPLSEHLSSHCCICLEGKHMRFTVMPFGLSVAPKIFTEVLSPVIELMKQNGFSAFPYIDDILGVEPTFEAAEATILRARQILKEAGFVINEEKSVLTPTKSIKHLGLIINSTDCTLSIPNEKIVDILNLAHTILSKDSVRQVTLAKLIGKLISISAAWALAHRFTWPLLNQIQYDLDWNAHISISKEALPKLIRHLKNYQPKSFLKFPTDYLLLHTDASLAAWGAILHHISSQGACFLWIAGGPWPSEPKENRIALLEARVVTEAVGLIENNEGKHRHLRVVVDNQNVQSYLRKNGRIPVLQHQYDTIVETITAKKT